MWPVMGAGRDAGSDPTFHIDNELDVLDHFLINKHYAKRALEHPDQDRAREDAIATAAAVRRVLRIFDQPETWSHAFAA